MMTTRQRLTPKGEQWRPRMVYGRMDRNPSNFQVMMELLDRSVTLYWQNRESRRVEAARIQELP